MNPMRPCLRPALAASALCLSFVGTASASPLSGKPPALSKPHQAPTYAVGPPAAIAVVTNKDNGGSVTLPPDTTLVVRLCARMPLQGAWSLLLPPTLPLRLASPRHTDARDEFQFSPHYLPDKTQTFFLRFVYVDPSLPVFSPVATWQLKVIVPPAFVEPAHRASFPVPTFIH